MSDMKHTPGPWQIHLPANPKDRESSLDVGISGIVEGQPKIIAEAFGQVAQTLYPPAEANARLIASAPTLLKQRDKLLEACKAVKSAYGSHQLYDKFPLPLIDAAIAEVEDAS